MPTPAPLDVVAFAARVGVDEAAVRKGIKNGRLERSLGRDAKGRVTIADVALAEQEWAGNREDGKARGVHVNSSISDQRKRLLSAQAEKVELAVAEKQGRLIDATRARRTAFEIARTVRDNILNIPDRVAHEFAAETDADKIHARLDDELRKALDALAETLAVADG